MQIPEDPLRPGPPEVLRQREVRVGLHVPNALRVPSDPPAQPWQRWFPVETGEPPGRKVALNPVMPGNEVLYFVDALHTFADMVRMMRAVREGDFIYMLGWFLGDAFELCPGDGGSQIDALFRTAAGNKVEIRAMLWDQLGTQNTAEVERINALPNRNGAAILDNRTKNLGSHHQKIVIIRLLGQLIAYCGGIDINPDRLWAKGTGPNAGGDTDGAPFHDVHCRIRGPAAFDLLQVFLQRWDDHPDSADLDRTRLAGRPNTRPLGFTVSRPPPLSLSGKRIVQIGRTFGNMFPTGYKFAPRGEQTARRMILHAIRSARRFIYMEDQYMVSLEARDALIAALPNIHHLTILIPNSSITPMGGQTAERRRAFLAPLLQAGTTANGNKVRVFILAPPGQPNTYVHSKMYIFDDRFAIIGSANCNRRSWTHDSEVVAGILDMPGPVVCEYHLAHQLRVALWAHHLHMDDAKGHAELADGVASAVHWLSPPHGRSKLPYVEPYDVNTQTNAGDYWKPWDTAVDPDGS
jgi:phosphatidylserine/phosphatidylglycerophosphate/cardiolipin synthase-like enzyme